MEKLILKYDGKKIEVKEPTIEMWTNVMKYKNLLDEDELNMKLLSETTGLSIKEIEESDVDSMRRASKSVYEFINRDQKKLYNKIQHNNKTYTLVDLNKMSFGQFIDIDTYLQKDEMYRLSNLNELASYLYIQENTSYSDKNFKQETEEFKTLPIKYIEGAIFFLSTLGIVSQQLTQLYSKNKLIMVMTKIRIRLTNIGGGILRYLRWPKTKFGVLTILLISPLLVVSIILHLFWITINKWKNKLKNK